uniref:SPATA6 domain-containing protein n=1 Tax=Echinococcus granulosus TaxID=6210 RepID=A0A068WNW1_ECHGR|nr:hypothetical protein EgrG_000460700 [Echinococcus granulosus]
MSMLPDVRLTLFRVDFVAPELPAQQVVLEPVPQPHDAVALMPPHFNRLVWPCELHGSVDRIIMKALKFNHFFNQDGLFLGHTKFEVFPCGSHVEFQLSTQIYAYGEKLPTTLTSETAYSNINGMSVEFENVQVSRFLAKLLLRVNTTRSERERRRAFENLLLQQILSTPTYGRQLTGVVYRILCE